MYIEIVSNSRKIYEIWHVRPEHILWNKEFFIGFVGYLHSKYPNDDFTWYEAKNSMCDFDLKEVGYQKGHKIFEQGKSAYEIIVQKEK